MVRFSQRQIQVRELLKSILHNIPFEENAYPLWLRELSGHRLELDFYIPTFKLAIEVQGEQHCSYREFFHGKIEGFHRQLFRDEKKRLACKTQGVQLIEIWDSTDVERLKAVLVAATCKRREFRLRQTPERAARYKKRRPYYIHTKDGPIRVSRTQLEAAVKYCKADRLDWYNARLRDEYEIDSHRTDGGWTEIRYRRINNGQAFIESETESEGEGDFGVQPVRFARKRF